MSLSTKAGQFTMPGSTGNQSVTGLGFQPKFIFFFYQIATANNSYGSVLKSIGGIGFTDGTNQASLGGAFGASRTTQQPFTTKCIHGSNAGSAASIVSMDSDGFTVNWSNVTDSGSLIQFLALGGSDLTNASIVSKAFPTATGNQSVTGVGFKPDCILLFANVDAPNANSKLMVGAASSTTKRAAQGSFAKDSSTQNGTSASNKLVEALGPDGSGNAQLYYEADLVSFDSDGFTANWSTVAGTIAVSYYTICLKGAAFHVQELTQPTSTGNQTLTGFGFQPKGIYIMDNGYYSSGIRTGYGTSFSASDGTNQYTAVINQIASGGGGTQSLDVTSNTSLIRHFTATTPTIVSDATLSSFDSDGLTLNWSVADSNQRKSLLLAFGNSSISPTISGISTIQGISSITF